MNPWIVLLALAAVALVFVLVPVGATGVAAWRRPVRLTCPRAGKEAQVRVSPMGAAVAALFGRNTAGIERCSLWSEVRVCHEECVALPEAERRPVPVGTPPPRPDRGPGVHTILVPLDGRPGSEAVLPAVADLARAHRATVRLLRVVSSPEAIASDDGTRMIAFVDQEAERRELESLGYLRAVARRLPGITVEETVRVGEAVTAIVDEAESAGADLIALASRRRGMLGRLARRSVAGRLRRATTIPTLVVRYGEGVAA
jgi:nucleotide-binding universal stress UspA family protein